MASEDALIRTRLGMATAWSVVETRAYPSFMRSALQFCESYCKMSQNRVSTAELLRALQYSTAHVSVSNSSMRGPGSAGAVTVARAHLGCLDLRPFGTRDRTWFRAELNRATNRLRKALPASVRHWGLARKVLNIFLRNCLYTVYLRERYRLDRAEPFFEVPLDSLTAKRICTSDDGLPRWHGVRALDYRTSKRYQNIAAGIAASKGILPVHLDAIWWGLRESDDSGD